MSYRATTSTSVQNWLLPSAVDAIVPERPTASKPSILGGQSSKSHVNHAYLPENSDSDSDCDSLNSGGSKSSSDCLSDPEWNASIGVKGDLFYIKPVTSKESLNSKDICASPSSSPNPIQNESHSGSPFKLRAKETLAKWVQKQNVNNASEVDSKFNENVPTRSQVKNYETIPTGQIFQVLLNLEQLKQNYGRRVTLCESLLGVIPAEDTEPNNTYAAASSNGKIIIRGLTPNGPAMKCDKLMIGDRILKLDDTDVTNSNLPQILARIVTPKKVKLLIERPMPQIEPQLTKPKPKSFVLQLVKSGLDHLSIHPLAASMHQKPHLVFYLRGGIGGEGASSPMDGILYQFPAHENKLSSMSGMFLTLAHLITEVTSSPPKSSSLLIEDQLVNVSYQLENRDVLVFGVPAECLTSIESTDVLANVSRLLRWQFQSLNRAFSDKENKAALDHFFSIFFQSLLGNNCPIFRVFIESTQCVPWYPLTPDLQAQIDTILSELESGDFSDMSEAFYETKRLYTILGSTFFYKGILCGNHLPKDDLLDVFFFGQYFQLLQLTSDGEVSQVVVWREVFPTRKSNFYLQDNELNNSDFKEQDGRVFLLMVALKHSLLCVLVEAGGCTSRAGNHPPPDPFYVDQARNVLLKMNSADIHIQIERCFENQLLPEIVSADFIVCKNKDGKKVLTPSSGKSNLLNLSRSSSKQTLNWKDTLGPRSLSHASLITPGKKKVEMLFGSPSKKTLHGEGERQQLIGSSPPDIESEAEHSRSRNETFRFNLPSVSSSSDADSRTSSEDIYRGLKSRRILSGSFDLSSLHTDLDEIESERNSNSLKLLSGNNGALFHYVGLNTSEGVLVSPLEQTGFAAGQLHTQILKYFQKCAANIHQIFQTMQKTKENIRNKEALKFNSDRSLVPVKEQGVLFHLNSQPLRTGNINFKKTTPTLAFWVVGRIFLVPEPKEVYVCFQDSTPQNTIELAFKLSFGTLI